MFPKACPKCHGDVFTERGLTSQVEMTCLQCGRTLDSEQAVALWAARNGVAKAA